MISMFLLPLIGLGIVAAFSGVEDDITASIEVEDDDFVSGSTAGDLLDDPETQDIISFIRGEDSLDIGPGPDVDDDTGDGEDATTGEEQQAVDGKDSTNDVAQKDKMGLKEGKYCADHDKMDDDDLPGDDDMAEVPADGIEPAEMPEDGEETDSLEGGADDDMPGEDTLEADGEDDMPGEDTLTGEDTTGGETGEETDPEASAPNPDAADDDTLVGGSDEDDMGEDSVEGTSDEEALQATAASDTVTGTAGDDEIVGFAVPIPEGGDAGEEDTGADVLLGEAGNDTITGNDGDMITGGEGADVIEVLGLDRIGESSVVVTDFDPEEDVLVLVDRFGSEVDFGEMDTADQPLNTNAIVGIRSAEDGESTEIVYDDRVIALLRGTEIDVLQRETAWLANPDALVLVQFAPA